MSRNGFRLLVVTLVLVAVGLVVIYSASAIFAYEKYGDSLYFLKRQILFFAIGLLGLIAASLFDPFWLKKNSIFFVALGVLSLVVLFLPGLSRLGGGARRWLEIGPLNLQPAEFIKIILTLYLADYLSRKRKEIEKGSLKVFFPPLMVLILFSGLVIIQPDLGSVIIFFTLTAVMFFAGGIALRYLIGFGLAVLPLVVILIVFFPYRLARVTVFLDPWNDPRGGGFQIIQSFLSFGLGGLTGVGLGESTQKLFYLPQSFTDFIFAMVGEELGLLGCLGLIALYIAFLFLGFRLTGKSKDVFLNLYVRGLTLMIVLQALINMMVATGVVPTKGLPLPFVSYGGSSLLMNMVAVGLLIGVDRKLSRTHRKIR